MWDDIGGDASGDFGPPVWTGSTDTAPSAKPASSGDGASGGAGQWASGLMQAGVALGTSYLSRRLDIDLQQRVAGQQPMAYVGGRQETNGDHALIVGSRAGPTAAPARGFDLMSLLPWLALAGVAIYAARRL